MGKPPAGAGGGSSPHTRGALDLVGGRGYGCRIIPAYAGSTLPGICATHDTTDHPRIRGEHKRETGG